jgi:outer membrane biosynthesis protein TonB
LGWTRAEIDGVSGDPTKPGMNNATLARIVRSQLRPEDKPNLVKQLGGRPRPVGAPKKRLTFKKPKPPPGEEPPPETPPAAPVVKAEKPEPPPPSKPVEKVKRGPKLTKARAKVKRLEAKLGRSMRRGRH